MNMRAGFGLTLLREAHNILRAYAPRIWPGWTAYDGLECFVTFPNRAVLILSGRARVPQAFEALPVPAIGSKRAYVDNSRALPGPIAGADIVELNPERDLNDTTARLGAKLVKEIASRMLELASPGLGAG